MKVYAKDCFERFGDDLTEVILQYLSFEEKIRLECVSKQWRRLVFNKQFVIEILSDYKQTKNSLDLYRKFKKRLQSINRNALKSVLKKCPNITKFDINTKDNSSVLSLIGRYCNLNKHRIKSLKLNEIISDDNTLDFFRLYGYKLEELIVEKSCKEFEVTKQIIDFSPNLITIHFCPNDYYNYFGIVSNDLNFLSFKCSQTIKTLNVTFSHLMAEDLKTDIELISRFENLKELSLNLRYINIHYSEPIDDCLSLIGQKCNKLLKLDLIFDKSVPITDQFFEIFSEFKSIKKLKINIMPKNKLSGSVECFKHCKQLIDLDINYDELREDFFANIASFVPKLQSLHIRTDNRFSDSFINNFNSMKNIQIFNHIYGNQYDSNWYFGKSVSEVMLSPNGMIVKHINHNCGLIIDQFISDNVIDSDYD